MVARAVLRELEARRVAGEDSGALDHAAFVPGEGQRTFRCMKAMATQPVGTVCHGPGIAPAAAARLDARYPHDRARRIEVGDLRGAFSIARPAPRASPAPGPLPPARPGAACRRSRRRWSRT